MSLLNFNAPNLRAFSHSTLAVASLATLLALSGQAAGQEKQPQPAGLGVQTLIAVERASLDKFLVDDRDAALKQALKLIPARLKELPGETKGELPPEAMGFATDFLTALAHPARFAVTYNPTSNVGGAFGYGIMASVMFAEEADLKNFSRTVERVIETNGESLPPVSQTFPGHRVITAPGGKLSFGTRGTDKGGTYDAFFGTVPESDTEIYAAIPKPTIEGLSPIIYGTFDFQALTPLANLGQMGVSQAANQEGIKPPNIVRELTTYGIVGPNAMKGYFEFGFTADASRSRVTVQNGGEVLKLVGTDTGKLSASDMSVVPADATSAAVGLVSTRSLTVALESARKQGLEVDEFLGHFREMTQVDFEKELLPSLGGVGGYYAADSTGGGGLFSHVAFLTFQNRDGFLASHAKILKTVQSLVRQNAREASKYIRIREWESEGSKLFTLITPGLPIPLEVTYAATAKHLIVGLSPQSVIAAVRQATGKGDAGLFSRKDIRLADPAKQEIISLKFSDTPRFIRDGYGTVSLVTSMISNGTRSPEDALREPGIIMPPYLDLIKGVKPNISIAHRVGNTLLLDGIGDRSVLAEICGTVGSLSRYQSLASLAGLAGAAQEQDLSDVLSMWAKPTDETQVARWFRVFESAVNGPMSVVSAEEWTMRFMLQEDGPNLMAPWVR